MTTIIYIRTSTEEQNPENQFKDCASLCDSEYEVVEEKKSAWKDDYKREGFNEILKSIKQRECNELIVWDLDRIYRNRMKLIAFFKEAKYYDCKIRSYRQKFLEDITTA